MTRRAVAFSVTAIAAAILLGGAFFRYEAVPAGRGIVFMNDRVFGMHMFCHPGGCRRVQALAPKPEPAEGSATGIFDDLVPRTSE